MEASHQSYIILQDLTPRKDFGSLLKAAATHDGSHFTLTGSGIAEEW